ncbi:MAG: MarR family transcriptional regulator [Coriobacteriia bacterium]|nr:MarR family transcriptional regulator [Coriobacteriia bacterium]
MHGPDRPAVAPEGVDQLSFDVFRALMDTVKLNGRLLMKTMAGHGGHPGQAGCLWALGTREGISQRELAEMVHLAPPTVTAMLQKMEKAGLIERSDDAEDQRITRIRLTETGRALDHDLRVAHGEYVTSTIGSMSEADRRELARLLGLLGNNISSALERLED